MAADRNVSLHQVATLIRGVSFRPNDLLPEGVGGIPLLRATNIGNASLSLDNVVYVPRDFVDQDQLLRRFDVVIAMSSGSQKAVGRLAQLQHAWEGCVGAFCGIVRPLPELIDPRYFGYVLASRGYRVHLESQAVGTAIMNLSRDRVLDFEFQLPPREEQERIAAVLGSLDDKIEQNRRTGAKLEELARAMFKAWFMDFEPVKAKAAGAKNFPSMPDHAFAALPARFADSQIGPVPEGWRVQSVADAFEVNPGRRLVKGADAPYLDMKNMPTEGHAPETWERREHGSGMRFVNGDTLVARITPCLENGKTAFVDFLAEEEVGWGSTEYIVLRPRRPLPEEFAYLLARTNAFREFAIQNMSGTSGRQRVAASAMEHYRLAVPTEPISRAFGTVVRPLFCWTRAAMNESRKLAQTRDYLLPKLLSGTVRVAGGGLA